MHEQGEMSGSVVALDALADIDLLAGCDLFVLVLRSVTFTRPRNYFRSYTTTTITPLASTHLTPTPLTTNPAPHARRV